MTQPLQVRFNSTAVKQARYDPARAVLDLWYAGGDQYSYFKVPIEVYEELLAVNAGGGSVGEFVNHRIKPHYHHELEPRRRRFRPTHDS